MFSTIASGHGDAADILFLIAAIVFVVGGIVAYSERSIWPTLVTAGLALVSVAWLLL